MGLGFLVLVTALFGAAVAAFVALRSKGGTMPAVLMGLISALIFAYLLGPLAEIGDPNFIESELRLMTMIILPIIGSAVGGFWLRRTRMKRGKN